jgi:hypothetical protein
MKTTDSPFYIQATIFQDDNIKSKTFWYNNLRLGVKSICKIIKSMAKESLPGWCPKELLKFFSVALNLFLNMREDLIFLCPVLCSISVSCIPASFCFCISLFLALCPVSFLLLSGNDSYGDEYLQYCKERQTKTRQGDNIGNIRKSGPIAMENKSDRTRCPVLAYTFNDFADGFDTKSKIVVPEGF